MLRKLLLGFFAVVAILCMVAAFRSSDFRVSRSLTINAPASAVFSIVNDFRAWKAWSPWANIDPDMKITFEGPTEGVGAIYRWSGNDQVGEGSTTMTESKPNDHLAMRLDMIRPIAGSNQVRFTFESMDASTKVTWAMEGKTPFVGRLFGIFFDCEKMCGDDFNKGLANLKQLVENKGK